MIIYSKSRRPIEYVKLCQKKETETAEITTAPLVRSPGDHDYPFPSYPRIIVHITPYSKLCTDRDGPGKHGAL